MLSIKPMATLVIASCLLLLGRGARGETPFSFFGYIGGEFLYENSPNEASGLAIAPDRSHLVVASDDGKLFFLNLQNYSSGHHVVDLSEDEMVDGRSDFEGVAIDVRAWDPSDMHVYVVHEGGGYDEPYLFKVEYGLGEDGAFGATVVDRRSLVGAIPCLEGSNGIESLGLKTQSGADPAVFFVGVQDTGKVYEITSEGESVGPESCYDSGLGVHDVSASAYAGSYLWSFIDREDMIAVVDPERDCTLAIYDTTLPANEEGLAIDLENGLMYVASDEQGYGPSVVSVYNFTHPEDLGECLNEGAVKSCKGFSVCGAEGSNSNAASGDASLFPTYFPTSYSTDVGDDDATSIPTSYPTYFTINFGGYDVVGDDVGDDDDSSSDSSSSSNSSSGSSFSSSSYDMNSEGDDYDDEFRSYFFDAYDDNDR